MVPQKWRGNLVLVTNDILPKDNYVITDDRGNVLSGGDIKVGLSWKAEPNPKAGKPARVHAPEALVKQLLLEQKVEMEFPDGH